MSRRTFGSPRRLGMESLESRELMAGNVSVSVNNLGDLIVTGDGQANQIQITQPLRTNGTPIENRFLIKGLTGTTVNGKPAANALSVTHDINVSMQGGSDKLMMGDGKLAHFSISNRLFISMDDANFGNDSVQINKIKVGDDVTINTGGGQDNVGFMASVGHGTSGDTSEVDVQINTAFGDDKVTILGGSVRQNLDVNTGSGNDTVYMQNLGVGGIANIFTGDETETGSDKVTLAVNVNIGGSLNINTGAGADAVSLDHVAADLLYAKLGSGSDGLTVKNTTARAVHFEADISDIDTVPSSDIDTYIDLGGNTFPEYYATLHFENL